MKVILKEYVYKHGVAGDVVTVADGFARNYLIPRGLAIKATPGALRENQHLIKQATQRREELRSLEHEAAHKIHGVELVFGVKAGKNRKLYGSITTRDIAQALLEKTGVDINRRRISERPLRELGVHEVPVRIAAHVSPVLRVVVIREEEVAPYLAGQQVASLAEEQVFEVIEAEDTLEAGEDADLEPAGEAEQPGESAE
ncbi:MAG: 50S ribosomal protein L9 [Chloroflexota bacterium]|jgi:large subunit ribosomal protein L9